MWNHRCGSFAVRVPQVFNWQCHARSQSWLRLDDMLVVFGVPMIKYHFPACAAHTHCVGGCASSLHAVNITCDNVCGSSLRKNANVVAALGSLLVMAPKSRSRSRPRSRSETRITIHFICLCRLDRSKLLLRRPRSFGTSSNVVHVVLQVVLH